MKYSPVSSLCLKAGVNLKASSNRCSAKRHFIYLVWKPLVSLPEFFIIIICDQIIVLKLCLSEDFFKASILSLSLC